MFAKLLCDVHLRSTNFLVNWYNYGFISVFRNLISSAKLLHKVLYPKLQPMTTRVNPWPIGFFDHLVWIQLPWTSNPNQSVRHAAAAVYLHLPIYYCSLQSVRLFKLIILRGIRRYGSIKTNGATKVWDVLRFWGLHGRHSFFDLLCVCSDFEHFL